MGSEVSESEEFLHSPFTIPFGSQIFLYSDDLESGSLQDTIECIVVNVGSATAYWQLYQHGKWPST